MLLKAIGTCCLSPSLVWEEGRDPWLCLPLRMEALRNRQEGPGPAGSL